jgi:hypothetical protein
MYVAISCERKGEEKGRKKRSEKMTSPGLEPPTLSLEKKTSTTQLTKLQRLFPNLFFKCMRLVFQSAITSRRVEDFP